MFGADRNGHSPEISPDPSVGGAWSHHCVRFPGANTIRSF